MAAETKGELPSASRAFLSYAREDEPFAIWLRNVLDDRGIEVFRDVDDTIFSEKWWLRIQALIGMADTFIFVLSQRSAASKVCKQEIAHAESLNKRIFPVVIENVDWASVPEGLASRHSVHFTDAARWQEARDKLVAALLTDIDWVREHTRLHERASLWEAHGAGYELLRGRSLPAAEQWIRQQPSMAEAPTNLHRAYIQASRYAANRRGLLWSLTLSAAMGAGVLYAWQGYDRGTLIAESEPVNSTIEVDGAALGARIRNLSLRSGAHDLRAWAPNHFEVRRAINLPRNGALETRFTLEDGRTWQKPYVSPAIQSGLVLAPGKDGLILVHNEINHIVLLSAATGDVAARIETPEGNKRTFLELELGGDVGKVIVSGLDAQHSGPEVLVVQIASPDKALWRWKGPATGIEQSASLAVAAIPDRTGAMTIAVAGRDGHVFILDGKTGRQIGAVQISTGPVPAAPVLMPTEQDGTASLTVFLHREPAGGTPADSAKAGALHALSITAATREIAWRRDLGKGWDVMGAPLLIEGVAYAVMWSDSRWQAIDLATGGQGRKLGGTLPSVPIGAPAFADLDGRGAQDLVFQPKDASLPLLAVRASTGATVWRGPEGLTSNQPRGPGNALLRTAGGAFLVQREDGLAAIDGRSGQVAWKVTGQPIGVVVGDWDGDGKDEIIVAMRGVGLLCLDDSGRTLWTMRMDESEVRPWALLRSKDGGVTNDILVHRPAGSIDLVHGPRILWRRTATALLQATPLIAKADDGAPVVIEIGNWGGGVGLRAFNGADGSTRWSAKEAFYPNRGAALADLDGSGMQLVVAVGHRPDTGTANLVVYRPTDGRVVRAMPVAVKGWFSSTPVIADYRGIGKSDVAFSTWDDRSIIMADGRTGAILWRHQTGAENLQGVAAGDLDGDGLPDVAAASFDGHVYGLRGKDGVQLWKSPIEGGSWTRPVIARLNSGAVPHVLVISQTGRLYVLDGRTGERQWSSEVAGGYKVTGHPVVVQHEGRTIILAPLGEAGLVAFDWARRAEIWRSPAGLPVIATPAEMTLSGGKTRAVIVAAATGDVWLLRIADGAPIWRSRVVEGFNGEGPVIEADPVIADLDGDGMPDVLIAGYDMKLHALSGTGSIGARR